MEYTFEQNLLNNLMETWVIPEIRARQEEGCLEKPFNIQMAQIIFYVGGRKPDVRLNSEVKGRMTASLSKSLEAPVAAGDPVYLNQLDGIEKFELDDKDRDNGHATLIYLGDKWCITFDFIYNKKSSQEHLVAAKEFLHAAKSCIDIGYLRAAVDNLHSASELASKAYLLGRPDKSILEAKSHDVVHRKINAERKLGNIDANHIDAFNMLRNLRSSARYLRIEFSISDEEANEFYNQVAEYIECVNGRSESKL